ncbi:hypothetical protein TNCV_854621 [Trichonephila clavipes]|nr:hypothetical protein TNCV_854621 [Trichonephila clavipes]
MLILGGLENISPPKELSFGLDFWEVRHIFVCLALLGIGHLWCSPLQRFPSNNSNHLPPWSTAPIGFDCSPYEHPRYTFSGPYPHLFTYV